MEEGKFRRKIGWFQFLSCLMVIWTHAGNAELFMGKLDAGHLLMRLQTKFVPAVMRICIPAFIMISGYQFFRGFTMEAVVLFWISGGQQGAGSGKDRQSAWASVFAEGHASGHDIL